MEDWWLDTYDIDGTEKEDTDGLDELFDTCDDTYDALEDIPEDLDDRCASFYILTVLSSQLSNALQAYKEVSEGYDEKVRSCHIPSYLFRLSLDPFALSWCLLINEQSSNGTLNGLKTA